MEKNPKDWSQGYGNGIFSNDQKQKIADHVETVEIPKDFMAQHYSKKPQFNYSPDFMDYRPLAIYQLYDGQHYNPRVELSHSAADFRAANEQFGFEKKPENYTWHHLFDAAGSPGILQLVNTKIHQRSCPHVGGNKQHLYQSTEEGIEVSHQVLDKNCWLTANQQTPRLLEKLAEKKIGLQKQFFLQQDKEILSCQMLFSGESVKDLVDASYLWAGSPLETALGLHPVGLDCGGDVIVADEKGKLYLLSHETNELESLSDDAPNLEKFLCVLTEKAVADL